jgi:thiosulfate reductase cytochrome b subunit
MQRVLIYKKFERIWHWLQALLVILLALSGFDIHYNWGLFGFEQAFLWHQYFAWDVHRAHGARHLLALHHR